MEEKNVTKVNLSTFLLIIAIIVIVIMGVFIYKLNNEKNIETKKSADLQTQVSSLNSIVNNLQSKINTISETVNDNASTTSTTTSKVEDANLTTYNGGEYTFNYNKNWKDLGIATKDSVGSVNRRVGALQLETETKDRVSILKHSNTTLSQYIENHKKNYLNSADEGGGFNLISEDSYNGNSLKGYKIVFKQMNLIYVSYLLESNNTVYEIEYPGSESNYNSIKSDLEKTVNSFKIN